MPHHGIERIHLPQARGVEVNLLNLALEDGGHGLSVRPCSSSLRLLSPRAPHPTVGALTWAGPPRAALVHESSGDADRESRWWR